MSIEEIVLPVTKPETEWVRGRALQKMSPTRDHGRLQMRIATALDAWSEGRGEVATEWRFRVQVPGEARRPLVPDVVFVAEDRLRDYTKDELAAPPFAPTVAVEILSPDDKRRDVESKIRTFLKAGTSLVIIVDPISRTMTLHDVAATRVLGSDEILSHEVLPGFELPLASFFAAALDR